MDGAPFNIDVGMRDGFGTPVHGAIFSSSAFFVSFSWNGTDCTVTSPAMGDQLITDSGATSFQNVTMEGKNNSTCILQFTSTVGGNSSAPVTEEPQTHANLVCQVILGGCSTDGQIVQEGDSVDTCGKEPVWGAILVVCLLLSLLCLVCVLFVVILMHQYRYVSLCAPHLYQIPDNRAARSSAWQRKAFMKTWRSTMTS